MVTFVEPSELPRRGVRLGDTPTLSVVVTSAGSAKTLERCLAVIMPACTHIGAEVIVVRAQDDSDAYGALISAHPKVRFIPARCDQDTPTLRQLGMTEAGGDLIMFQSDDSVGTEWFAPRLLANQRSES